VDQLTVADFRKRSKYMYLLSYKISTQLQIRPFHGDNSIVLNQYSGIELALAWYRPLVCTCTGANGVIPI